MNIAVVGHGYWGANLARDFHKLGVLDTICDSDGVTLTRASRLYPDVSLTPDYNCVLNNKRINGVVIATRSSLHYPMARQALLAGKDVFVEKPFTLNTADAVELVDLSENRQRILLIGHLMLYHPAVRLLKEYIQDGELGKIHYLYSTRVNLGQVRNDENVLWRLATHDLSIFLYLLDASYHPYSAPSIVSARGFSYIQTGIYDVVFALLRFGDTVAHIQVSWLDPHKVRQLTVVGSNKMAVFDDMAPYHKLRIYDKSVDRTDLTVRSGGMESPDIETTPALSLECAEFVDCIATRRRPLSDARSGLEVVRLLEEASALLAKEEM